ncbi:hypothetical protein AXG93_1944s1010 [Marchantia polymorpha subsp. ruderalis]|uniref:Uncharacterized protein n=1 Tax=Marchantia polymorpha subsp. ruderalis TaxID=1480154 RepID=A0A176VG25_MARPO|nr:hypothetical protein AXG93_1944s1010 [Marchantia polymorpha subsp. ruderalis]
MHSPECSLETPPLQEGGFGGGYTTPVSKPTIVNPQPSTLAKLESQGHHFATTATIHDIAFIKGLATAQSTVLSDEDPSSFRNWLQTTSNYSTPTTHTKSNVKQKKNVAWIHIFLSSKTDDGEIAVNADRDPQIEKSETKATRPNPKTKTLHPQSHPRKSPQQTLRASEFLETGGSASFLSKAEMRAGHANVSALAEPGSSLDLEA